MEDELMKRMIEPLFIESNQTYGARRLKASLERTGINTSRRRMHRLMAEEGLVPKQGIRWHKQTTQADEKHEKAPNLLDQDFKAAWPNQKWVVDITYIATQEGWLYLAVLLDLFSRAVVGWSMQKKMTKALVMQAWQMACAWRHPPEALLHHSDLGSQYTSKAYLDLLREKNCQLFFMLPLVRFPVKPCPSSVITVTSWPVVKPASLFWGQLIGVCFINSQFL